MAKQMHLLRYSAAAMIFSEFTPGTAQATASIRLNNGVDMPVMAVGASLGWDAETCKSATSFAFQAGFRNLWSSILEGEDCQKAQAEAIAESGIARSELFIAATACSNAEASFKQCGVCNDVESCYQQTKASAEGQFDLLGVDTLDMLFLDKPTEGGCDNILGQWRALEELYAAGRVRALAVDNFGQEQMQCILNSKNSTVPTLTMSKFAVGHGHDTVVEDNAKHNITVFSFSPLGDGALVSDELCESIGAKYGKSAVQVALKWVLQRGATLVTQSTKLSHLQGDVDIFDFTLSDDDMTQLNDHRLNAVALV
jgi:diketogulonate reductase-like aldo/keto reductase